MKLVIFDADGTLFDSIPHYVETFVHSFEHFQLSFPRDEIARYIGMGGDKTMRELCSEEWLREHELTFWDKAGEIFFSKYVDDIKHFPKVPELIRVLRDDDHHIALATMTLPKIVEKYLKLFDSDHIFDYITTVEDVEKSKPDPDIFLDVLNKYPHVPIENVVAIGDSVWDMMGMKAAGLKPVGVASGAYQHDELFDAGAHSVFDHIEAFYHDYMTRRLT